MEYQTPSEFAELLKLYQALPRRTRVLEIGSMLGDTLMAWLQAGDLGMTLISVDKIVPPADSRHLAQTTAHSEWQRRAIEEAANLMVIDDYSQAPETIARVKAALGGGGLDFLFIDGGHDYETVKADFLNYAPLVAPGGTIAFHDIQGIPDVNRFWNELKIGLHRSLPAELPGDPRKFQPPEFTEICHPQGWGIGVVRPAYYRVPLHIITPCSRPENLGALLASLLPAQDYFDLTWWIVADGSKIKKLPKQSVPGLQVRHKTCTVPDSVAGKAQINLALEQIQDGWVWVLDDDNVAHPHFFQELYHQINQAGPGIQALAFAQINRQGGIRAVGADTVRECAIDQAQFVLRRDLIGATRYLHKYTADGAFAERLFRLNPEAWAFCKEPLTYYNWLKP